MEFLNEVTEYRELVISGLTKMFNSEEMTVEERQAFMLFIKQHSMNLDSYTAISLIENVELTNEDYLTRLKEGLLIYVENTFSSYYGIR